MTDREKVMSWLEGLAEPDWRVFHSDSEVQSIAKFALAMLKEQEAVKPMLITWDHPLKGVAYVCPNCKKEARDYWKYCPFCGKAIDWEGR